MSDTISIDQAGRLVLPKAIRDRFRIRKGTRFEVAAVGDHVELTPMRDEPEPELIEKRGLTVVKNSESFDAVKAIADDRDGRDAHLGK